MLEEELYLLKIETMKTQKVPRKVSLIITCFVGRGQLARLLRLGSAQRLVDMPFQRAAR
ncbi:hypothetical protein FIBSPDRAFT_120684 [Athelia psychrophila]|uniref:Uncharacterized protein n=1 Tax=Athelia psychrophila TaxID=1759441 RepID=A0A166CS48_9AGAM|nr:hypothetical protein FIBSPDRAFT_120684 [Fibularhizoctonia sp. CBS 109695]